MLNRIAFDDAMGHGGVLARLKLVGELARIKISVKEVGDGALAAVKRLKQVARANQIRIELGAHGAAKPAESVLPVSDGNDQPQAPRNATAQYYEFDPNRKPAQRKKDNIAAMALLKHIDAGEVDPAHLTAEEKLTLAKYSGTGGALIGADGKKGSAYEYYTPKPIAEGIWGLMGELGFAGGKVLDPCAGVGIFGATAPLNAAIDAVELNETSGRINSLINAGPGYTATVAPFERVAAATPDEQYDAIVTNVPFGGVADRGGNQLLDGRYQKEPLQNYFILRTLEKLKPGGLAVFITPPRCVSGKGGKEEELRVKASYMAEFLGAYRLPNSVFGTASADTMTDVIAFRKYSREALDKIAELREQSPRALIDANVQWQPFIEGHYFEGEGKRFVLGEFVPKDPAKFRDVDRVITPASLSEIGKMLKRFPGSRVEWDMLGTVETTPIIYRDGDTITQAGQTLQMQSGRWVPMARGEDSASMAERIGRLATPYAAFEGRIQWTEAEQCVNYMIETSQSLDIPDWLRGAMTEIRRLKDEGERAQFWNAGIVGMAASQVLQERLGEETGVNFAAEYPALTDAMQRVSTTAKKRPAVLGGRVRDGLVIIGNHYQKKTGFSAIWRGDVQQQTPTVEITADASFEGLRYKTKSIWVSLEDAKAIYGEGFDPFADPAWCLSPDGKSVTRADDYYVGNYAEFLRRVDADIANAASDAIRAKLLRQKLDAGARIDKVDVSKLTFNLFSPHVTLEEKAEFLRRFVHPSAAVIYDERTGEKRVDIDVPGSNLTDREKLLNRIGDYLKNGTITLGGTKLGMDDAKALQELRRMVNTANEQFNGWVRGNRSIVARLEAVAVDPEKLRFRQVEDETPMPIPGMNEGLKLHGYQNAYVRKTSREFGGINGFGVGLGKTFTALAATQYVQSIGVKSKTLFVVPNSVLSNWRKEATRAYANTGDCLFVGLRVGKDGRAAISSTNFDADLTTVMENRHSKIFMTLEAFERIRLRDETISVYEAFMRQADSSFAESMDKKEDERAKSKQAGLLSVLSDKRGGAPYLEDMGVDSIVFDEGHCFPAGTLIDGVPIERIRVGDFVRSFNHDTGAIEKRRVMGVMSRRAIGLVRVRLKNGQCIVCTHDHEFFVHGVGYVAAEFLNSGYNVAVNYSRMVHDNALQPLRNGVQADQGSGVASAAGKQGLLLDGMFKRVQDEENSDVPTLCAVRDRVRVESRSELEGCNREGGQVLLQPGVFDDMATCQLGNNACGDEQRGKAGEAQQGVGRAQLAANPGSCGEEPARQACQGQWQGDSPCEAGRQREANCYSAEDAGGCLAVADRVSGEDRSNEGRRDTVSLQAGHGPSATQDRRGGGWQLASVGEGQGIRREKGCVLGLVGVDSVEVLEHGGDGEFGGLCPGGHVYDITVDGNHNFFAEGILVHNCFKDSAQTVDFKGAKFLSLSPASRRGIDAQAKAWFIRGKSDLKDGVMVLTATPITNSPLEIYAMLSLAVGHERVNDVCLGIHGADDFMEMMCVKENQDDVTMDGVARTTDVFVGLNNVGVLRKAIGEVATIKSAEDVGEQIVVPDREEKAAPVTLPTDVVERLKLYKGAFRWAIDEISEKSPNRGDHSAYEQVAQHFGEELNLIGHPFNLINKMTLLIADPELDQRATFYSYLPTQADKAKVAIEQFNARKFMEERPRPGPMTDETAIVGNKTVKDAGGNETELLKIEVRAKVIDGGRVVLDTIDPDVQSAFEAIAEKLGLDLDVSVPPKLAAMLENFQHEQASPRGIDADGQRSSVVKQIVFCDILPLHNKIKRLLTRRAGVPAAAIAIITGRTNNTPDEILAVQDGFNGTGEDNKYQTVIANEKAEVGINLQRGTQAIHHLTIGWTPDSLEQRNGRGVRQGNLTARVNLYYYDADGTFDTSKRAMVNKKADWIGQVMDVNGSDSVAVTGGLSKEQMEALIDVVGDADAMRRMQETIASKEAAARASSNRDRQMINLDTIRKQNAFLNDNQTAASFVIRKIIGLWGLEKQAEKLRDRISNPKATATAVAKNENLLAELMASIGGLRRQIEQSASLYRTEWRAGGSTSEPATLDSFFATVRGGKKQKDDDIESMLLGRSYPSFGIHAIEGGPISNDWQAEVDMAKSMIDEAKIAFFRQSEEAGSYPADVAEAIARGEGIIYNGKPLIHGTFVRVPGGLAVLTLASGRPSIFGRSLDSSPLAANATAVMAGEWFYRGLSGYDSCLTDAAQIEDTVNAAGTVENGFNVVVPEVVQRRKVEALAAYSAYDYWLPQPYFPFAVSPTEAETSEVLRRIFDSQKAIVRSFENGEFVVPSDTAVVRRASNSDSEARYDALREFAVANGLKLTVADFGEFHLWVQRQIEKAVSLDDLKAALTGDAEPEIIEQASAFMRAAAPWFDWQEKDPASDYLPYGYKAAIDAAVRKVVAGSQPVGPSPSDVVGIRGNTKAWKETIKQCANAAGFGKYKWDGDALVWNVYRSTWDHLIRTYSKAAEQLELTAGTRSL